MNKILNRLVWVIALLPGVYVAMVWNSLPEKVAMHFDFNGKPDRYGNKSELVLMTILLFVVSLVVYYLMVNINRIDPKRYARENSSRFQKIGFVIVLFLSSLTTFIIYSSVHGGGRMDINLVLAGVCLLLAVIGNYMPNIKPNYFAGIRLPWTLESPENWRATHALAGKIWFLGGLVLCVTCFLLPQKTAFIVVMTGILLMVLIPSVYSWRFYQKQKNAE
jgi:uncharacterized membrane protein